MSTSWRLVQYVCPGGKCPVYEFLRELREADFKAWYAFTNQRVIQLKEWGPNSGPPYWTTLGGGLGEIKWRSRNRGRARIYGSVESERRILMYLGVIKRWDRFTDADRRQCENYRAEMRSADYDEQRRELERCAYYKRRGERNDI